MKETILICICGLIACYINPSTVAHNCNELPTNFRTINVFYPILYVIIMQKSWFKFVIFIMTWLVVTKVTHLECLIDLQLKRIFTNSMMDFCIITVEMLNLFGIHLLDPVRIYAGSYVL